MIKFLEEVLDQNHHIKPSYINKNNWDNMIIPDIFYYRDAEWLLESLDLLPSNLIEIYHFEYGPIKEERIELVYDEIEKLLSNLGENENKYTILTNRNRDFLIYKFQCEDYFIVFGSERFVANATKCSHHVEKKWFSAWISGFSDIGKNEAHSLWEMLKGSRLEEMGSD